MSQINKRLGSNYNFNQFIENLFDQLYADLTKPKIKNPHHGRDKLHGKNAFGHAASNETLSPSVLHQSRENLLVRFWLIQEQLSPQTPQIWALRSRQKRSQGLTDDGEVLKREAENIRVEQMEGGCGLFGIQVERHPERGQGYQRPSRKIYLHLLWFDIQQLPRKGQAPCQGGKLWYWGRMSQIEKSSKEERQVWICNFWFYDLE